MMLLRILKDALPNKRKGLPSPLGMELEEKSIDRRNACSCRVSLVHMCKT